MAASHFDAKVAAVREQGGLRSRLARQLDAGRHLPIAMPTPTTALRPRGTSGTDPLEQLRQLIRNQPLRDRNTTDGWRSERDDE
ncbi:hypothetical protein [Streptomyces sp. NPDC095613]|uniref:hypothetical protein n=1 Tax=Streptomyces sp. NPDC095613 TaxID=3155540 RepID=UPI003332E37E